jgi:hypothetical protein
MFSLCSPLALMYPPILQAAILVRCAEEAIAGNLQDEYDEIRGVHAVVESREKRNGNVLGGDEEGEASDQEIESIPWYHVFQIKKSHIIERKSSTLAYRKDPDSDAGGARMLFETAILLEEQADRREWLLKKIEVSCFWRGVPILKGWLV